MKKLLLFGLALSIGFSGFSQRAKSYLADTQDHTNKHTDFSFTKTGVENAPVAFELKSNKQVLIERLDLGVSGNVFSVLNSYQRCLAYDEASNTILGTYRADPGTYPEALASGTIMAHTSSDGGQSWNHVINLNPNPDDHALRYPSGVLYNHTGSSNPDDLYAVAAGPSHTAGTWDMTYYGSVQITDANNNDEYQDFSGNNDWDSYSMTAVPEAVYFFGREMEDAGSSQGVNQTMMQYVGTTDDPAEGFDWETNSVTPDWYEDAGVSIALYNTWSAWSKDGSIGYMWMVGVTNDSEEYGGYQPQVFFTEDGGDDWDEIELNMEDHPVLVEFLPPWEDAAGNPGTVKPTMGISEGGSRNFPGVVDSEGRLHIFAQMFGMSTESAADPSSGYWTVGENSGGHIFDIVLNTDGLQDLIFVDSVFSKKPPSEYWGDTPVNWDHRLQASKSVDETVVFAVWADDTDHAEGILNNPDIIAWAYNTQTGNKSAPINFTEDDLYSGFFFFHFVSEYTPFVDGEYKIPVAITLSPEEFSTGLSTAPSSHYFLDGISFPEIVGVEDNIELPTKLFTVTQNTPNPFNGTTTISVSTETASAVMVEVSNIMGQTIYNVNSTVNGTQEITLNSNNMEAGVYFYTVSVGEQTITKKMVVK